MTHARCRVPKAPAVLGLALLLASATAGAAQPSAPPAPKVTAVPAPAWEKVFRKQEGWIGSDCAYSVPLGGGRILWLFGDTFYGRIQDGKRILDGPMARNSIAIQRGREPETAQVTFFFGNESAGKRRTAFMTPPGGGGWYWFGGGVVADACLYFPRFVLLRFAQQQ